MPRPLPALAFVLLLALGGCARPVTGPVEQRTTIGPTAEQFWLARVLGQTGREPSFEERRQWETTMEDRIGGYLRTHPEAANSLHVTNFRFRRQVAVGMAKEQVVILLGAPLTITTAADEMEKLARRFWPEVKAAGPTEAWTYPGGWRFYFEGARLVDITQHFTE